MLKEHFSEIVDYDFTAEMENDLDKIALGKKQWQPIISFIPSVFSCSKTNCLQSSFIIPIS
jgi:DNA topoisomerase IA